MTLILGAMAFVFTAAVIAIRQCPLARAIGLSVQSFAEASRGAPDTLR